MSDVQLKFTVSNQQEHKVIDLSMFSNDSILVKQLMIDNVILIGCVLTPIVPKLSGFRLIFFLHRCVHIHLTRYHRDLGLGMTLKGVGRVPPSSK